MELKMKKILKTFNSKHQQVNLFTLDLYKKIFSDLCKKDLYRLTSSTSFSMIIHILSSL